MVRWLSIPMQGMMRISTSGESPFLSLLRSLLWLRTVCWGLSAICSFIMLLRSHSYCAPFVPVLPLHNMSLAAVMKLALKMVLYLPKSFPSFPSHLLPPFAFSWVVLLRVFVGLYNICYQWNKAVEKNNPHLYQQNVERTTNNGAGEKAGDMKLKIAWPSEEGCRISTFCIT